MVRIARKVDPRKIAFLKKIISDPRYVALAVKQIAHQLTEELIERIGSN